jgi:DNA-binding MarR family transcriptional regulator
MMIRRDAVDDIVSAWRAELPAVAGLEFELVRRTARLHALLTEPTNARLARLGLTRAEFEVLALLRTVGAPYQLRPTDLAVRLLLSSGGTSNLLRRLSGAGLVDRRADANDARSSWVRLTATGVRIAETAVRASTKAQVAVLRSVPQESAEAASDALREVLLALGDAAAA